MTDSFRHTVRLSPGRDCASLTEPVLIGTRPRSTALRFGSSCSARSDCSHSSARRHFWTLVRVSSNLSVRVGLPSDVCSPCGSDSNTRSISSTWIAASLCALPIHSTRRYRFDACRPVAARRPRPPRFELSESTWPCRSFHRNGVKSCNCPHAKSPSLSSACNRGAFRLVVLGGGSRNSSYRSESRHLLRGGWEKVGRKETRSRGRSGSAWPVLRLNTYDLVSLVWLTGMISVRTQTGHKHDGDHSSRKECDQR